MLFVRALLLGLLPLAPASAAAPCRTSPYVVALDIGHTRAQPGATSARGVPEFEFNLQLAGVMRAALVRAGFGVVMIGESGAALQLAQRTRLAAAQRADLFLSVHHDSVQPQYLLPWNVGGVARVHTKHARGYSVFVSAGSARGRENIGFGRAVGAALRRAGFTPSLHHAEPIAGEGRVVLDGAAGLYRFDELLVLRTAAMPAALLEAGVIVNRDEEALLSTSAVRERMAGAVVTAVGAVCGG